MDKGVNLGNWLALEKWMSPELFDGTDAEDEFHLCSELSDVAKRERFKVHRDTWINDRDFVYLASRGIDFVRLPVPFFAFEDYGPFVACIDYVDKAFDWAEQRGVRILLDLHTVPDSQNGFDNGGICGVCKFHKDPKHVDFALDVLEQLARRYGDRDGLWGIEVLNEPVSPELWALLDVPKRYPAVDKEYAEGSEAVPTDFLKSFYQRAYERIRATAGDVRIVFHDGFRIGEWPDFFTGPDYENFVVGTHMYVMMHTVKAPDSDLDGYVTYIESEFGGTLTEAAEHFPVMVGEWNLDTKSPKALGLAGDERRRYYTAVSDAYFEAFEPAAAWSYWAYKLHGAAPEIDVWDMERAIELGYLPETLSALAHR